MTSTLAMPLSSEPVTSNSTVKTKQGVKRAHVMSDENSAPPAKKGTADIDLPGGRRGRLVSLIETAKFKDAWELDSKGNTTERLWRVCALYCRETETWKAANAANFTKNKANWANLHRFCIGCMKRKRLSAPKTISKPSAPKVPLESSMFKAELRGPRLNPPALKRVDPEVLIDLPGGRVGRLLENGDCQEIKEGLCWRKCRQCKGGVAVGFLPWKPLNGFNFPSNGDDWERECIKCYRILYMQSAPMDTDRESISQSIVDCVAEAAPKEVKEAAVREAVKEEAAVREAVKEEAEKEAVKEEAKEAKKEVEKEAIAANRNNITLLAAIQNEDAKVRKRIKDIGDYMEKLEAAAQSLENSRTKLKEMEFKSEQIKVLGGFPLF